MKILVASNPYKGTLSALEASRAIAAGLRRMHPGASFEMLPLADGGPGTLEAVHAALGGRLMHARVRGPLGNQVGARWLRVNPRLALIESAQAIGLDKVQASRKNALKAGSYGLGQLMLAAVASGCRELWIGLGGSATTDAGIGMALALGSQLALRGTKIRVLCDVDNPLYGPHGAAQVFAPQKGAGPKETRLLEARLRAAAKLMPPGLAQLPGAGAAGGLGAGLMAFAGASLVPGASTLLELCGFYKKLKDADLVVSGEGRLDAQSLRGKLPVVLARAALKAGKGAMLVCGEIRKGIRLRGVELRTLDSLK